MQKPKIFNDIENNNIDDIFDKKITNINESIRMNDVDLNLGLNIYFRTNLIFDRFTENEGEEVKIKDLTLKYCPIPIELNTTKSTPTREFFNRKFNKNTLKILEGFCYDIIDKYNSFKTENF